MGGPIVPSFKLKEVKLQFICELGWDETAKSDVVSCRIDGLKLFSLFVYVKIDHIASVYKLFYSKKSLNDSFNSSSFVIRFNNIIIM